MRQRELRRGRLAAQLQAVGDASTLAALDPAAIQHHLRERLTDWQGLLKRETVEARVKDVPEIASSQARQPSRASWPASYLPKGW